VRGVLPLRGCVRLQVSNYTLYKIGKLIDLPGRMTASKFDPHINWLPPGYLCPEEKPTNWTLGGSPDDDDAKMEAALNGDELLEETDEERAAVRARTGWDDMAVGGVASRSIVDGIETIKVVALP